MITAREIANKRFDKASFGGYRTDDVDGFLNEVAAELEALDEQNNALNKKLEVLAEKVEEYRSEEESLRTALLGAQKLGDSIIRESKSKAEIILRDATIKADRAVSTAHDQVEREKMIYLKLQKDVSAFKSKLLAIYRQHLEIISSLPDEGGDKEAARAQEAEEPAEAPKQEAQPHAEQHAEPAPEACAAPVDSGEPAPRFEPANNVTDADEYYEVQIEDNKVFVSKQDIPAQADGPEAAQAEDGRPAANNYEEPKAPQKFVPVSGRHADNGQGGKFDEYYEDFDDEDSKLEVAGDTQKKSRFGTLKFGSGYDLKRD